MTATSQMEMPQSVSDDFFAKDIPEPYQILGLKLLPLSIGRYRRMVRHGIAFVAESKAKASARDLILGVLICSLKCRHWDELAASSNLPKTITKWMRQINVAPPFYLRGTIGKMIGLSWIGQRWRAKHSFNIIEKIGLFKAYIDEAQKIPKFLRRKDNFSTSTAHWSHNIEVVLRGELGWTREEIEERPLSSALADYFKFMENQGMITILSDADFEEISNNDAAIARALEQLKAKEATDGV